MIGLDTNVLLRLFIEDDREQCQRARSFVEEAARNGPCMVNVVVLVEFVWALKKLTLPKVAILNYLEGVLEADDLEVERRAAALIALDAYRSGPADFADYLLGQINAELGCSSTVSFDGDALKSPVFSSVP